LIDVMDKTSKLAARGFPSRSAEKVQLESLILAQNERWRRALHMQVERGGPQGPVERRTGE
jgi:hypothetical protein